MKKFWAILLALAMLTSCMLCACNKEEKSGDWTDDQGAVDFANQIGGVSETYEGAVSEENYTDADTAAEAYVINEVISAEAECQIVDTTAKGSLTVDEAVSAGIPADYLTDAVSVEKYQVTYTETQASAEGQSGVVSLSSSSSRQEVVVYIICFSDYFKYFSPVVETGSTLTKSYYDSIFNSEKYSNCTFTNVSNISIVMEYYGQKEEMYMNTTSTTKYDGDKIWIECVIESTVTGVDSSSYQLYVENDENGNTVCYVNLGSGWQSTTLYTYGFSSTEDLMPFAGNYLDHTYFDKTDYGCELATENLAKYMAEALALLASIDSGVDTQGYIQYFVSEGVLSGIRGEVSVEIEMETMGVAIDMVETIVTDSKCLNYGTTVVERPDGI